VKDFLKQNGLENKVILLSESPEAKGSKEFQTAVDFPAIYQSAVAMIYPSFFEGFGIPVLEALWSGLPVITSNVSCLPEAGGEGAWYVDPNNAAGIAEGMKKIANDPAFASTMIDKGRRHAQHFTQQHCASAVMDVYHSLF
jgi:glycosyltransferase involved in cell wall biosynthesis